MSTHIACTCPGTRKEKMKNWRVRMRHCNFSYFQSPPGGWHPSDYSQIVCVNCNASFRTTASYVDNLKDSDDAVKR